MYRQGDVLIVQVANIPEKVREVARDHGRVVLAYGESTGHAHAIMDRDVWLFRDPTEINPREAQYLRVATNYPVALTHEEHREITLPPGDYRVIQQRELKQELKIQTIRAVMD